jgi:prepilin-type N-terminal cleavage/methylation domain-containing protein
MGGHLMRRHSTQAERRASRGFSIIELLIVVAVSTVGFVALFDLQAGTLRGMQNMRMTAEATNLAENFIERLRVEFMAWTDRADGQLDGMSFPHLAGLPVGNAVAPGAMTPGDGVDGGTGWVIAGADVGGGADRRVSVVGDVDTVLGTNVGLHQAMVDPGVAGEAQQPFCLLYRLTWLIPGQAIRVEVEVSWPLENAPMDTFMQCNQIAANQLHQARSVNLTTTLSANVFGR